MSSPIFSNSQFTEWLHREYDQYFDDAYDHLKSELGKHDFDEFTEMICWAAVQKMTTHANEELAHHNQKLKKYCGFGNCKYLPSCLRGLE